MTEASTPTGTDKIAAALAKAQGDMTPAGREGVNPHFKRTYATLAAVWEACREPLSKNELSIVQLPFVEAGVLYLRTVLLHSSGQAINGVLPVISLDNRATPQAVGSALTYARRYALASIVGVAPEDETEDDGQVATTAAAAAPPKPAKPKEPSLKELAEAFVVKIKTTKTVLELTTLVAANAALQRKIIDGDPSQKWINRISEVITEHRTMLQAPQPAPEAQKA